MKQTLAQNIRYQTFWLLDRLKGGPVRKHLDEIRHIMEHYPNSKQLCEHNLRSLLGHATATVSFYKTFKGKTLSEFPVINKTIIKAQPDEFLSSAYPKDQLIKGTTSGSTGTPFVMYQDIGRKQRTTADATYFAGREQFVLGDRLFYLKIWSDLNHKPSHLALMQNVVPIEVMHLGTKEIESLLKEITITKGRVGLLGYASAMEQVARYIDKHQLAPVHNKVFSILSMSETLSQYTKDVLEIYFGVKPVARYSSIECGIMAQQCAHSSNEYHINIATHHVEILDLHTDTPVPDGQTGRIVITDMYNFGMPFIRYDTGDIGAMSATSACNFNTPVLTRIDGRKLDQLFNTSGEMVNSLLVYKNMWQYPEIDQYQLVQKGEKEYAMRISMTGQFERAEKLISEFKTYLGDDADFTIEYVREIPLLSSGKRRKVINEYHKQVN